MRELWPIFSSKSGSPQRPSTDRNPNHCRHRLRGHQRGYFFGQKAQLKKGIVSDYLLPDVALVSPVMTLTCPRSVTAASGVDALVHAIESYISVNRSPITDAIALGAIRLIARALPKAYANPDDLVAREEMATASLMGGMAFGNAGVGAVHALAYPLGGRFNIAHGVSNALLLPYVMRWNKLACAERLKDVAQAMGISVDGLSDLQAADAAVTAMAELCSAVGIPTGLRAFSVPMTHWHQWLKRPARSTA